MGSLERLRELREKTGSLGIPPKEFWNSPDSHSPEVAKGILVELLGNARTEWLLKLFVANPEALILWFEGKARVLPTAVFQRGVESHRVKFIAFEGDLFQPLRLALESQHYPFIVAPNQMTEVRSFQRLHLLAEKACSTVFLFGDKAFSNAWPVSLQVEVSAAEVSATEMSATAEGFRFSLQRNKHGRTR